MHRHTVCDNPCSKIPTGATVQSHRRHHANETLAPTRKPEELSRRQRKRQTKLRSRKEEFSGGSLSGSYFTWSLLHCKADTNRHGEGRGAQ